MTIAAPVTADRPAHRDGNVLRWLTAYAVSAIGDNVCFLALGWAAQQVASPAQVGMVMAAAGLPRAVLMLGGGVVADRYGPRLVVIGSDAVRCVVILTVAAWLALATPGLWLLVCGALVFGAVDALFMPAVGALPPRITARGQLARVQGMRALVIRIGNTTGPPLSGFVMGFGGVAAAFALAGGLFAVSLVLLLAVRIAPPASCQQPAEPALRATAWSELADGLRYLRRHPLLGPLVLSGALSEFALNGPLNVGLVLLAGERGWGASGMAWIVSAFGAGAGLSALLITVLGRLPRAGTVAISTLVVASAGIASVGVTPTLGGAIAVAGASGLFSSVAGGLANGLIQTTADPAYLGRVTSVTSLSSFGLSPLSFPLFGAAAAVWGTSAVFVACGAFSMFGAAVAIAAPAVRRAELPPVPVPN
ncbi:MAG: MFS transporter [Streptomyces sp.]|uniref:MFS transporter n=1 Tax=Streptomyces sp. TaxID=1931 RepID=UPI003D6B4E24